MVPYEITEKTFTILSALNLLFKSWIPLATEDAETGQRKVRVGHLLRRTRAAPSGNLGRTLSGREVIELTMGQTTSESRLQRKVYQHMGSGKELPREQPPKDANVPTAAATADTPTTESSHTVAKRQIYEESDLFYPWEPAADSGRITRRLIRDPDRRIELIESKPTFTPVESRPWRPLTDAEALAKRAYWAKYNAEKAAESAANPGTRPVEPATIEEISDDDDYDDDNDD
jgi:hypothetical protein